MWHNSSPHIRLHFRQATHLTSTMSTVFSRTSRRTFWNITSIFCSKSSKIASFFANLFLVRTRRNHRVLLSSQSFLLAILLCLADHAISLEMYCPSTPNWSNSQPCMKITFCVFSHCETADHFMGAAFVGKRNKCSWICGDIRFHLKWREIKCHILEIVSFPFPSLFWYLYINKIRE